MKALISREQVFRISGYNIVTENGNTRYDSITEPMASTAWRIAEVAENEFEVAPDLFWVDCNSSVKANQYYYDSTDSTIKLIDNAPLPQ